MSQIQSPMQQQKLVDFLNRFVAEHTMAHDDEKFILDVTPEEAQDVGRSVIRVICGWAVGLDRVRLHDADRDQAFPVELLINVLSRSIRLELSGMEQRIMQRLGGWPAIVDDEELVALRKGD